MTSDGMSASGTFTIPASCTSLYVRAWGAAGAASSDMTRLPFDLGGAGGFVDGVLAVTPGDTVTVWLGQGGDTMFGQGGNGSYLGTAAPGGNGGGSLFAIQGGGGGGLTSVQITGAATTSFSVPGGGGGGEFGAGGAASVSGGGGHSTYGGETDVFNSDGGGGGGENGGTIGLAGAYGTLPAGLTAYDGVGETPAGTVHADYSQCTGANNLPAGESEAIFGVGGDGCVVLRCVAQ